jgi:hypothetical protein
VTADERSVPAPGGADLGDCDQAVAVLDHRLVRHNWSGVAKLSSR